MPSHRITPRTRPAFARSRTAAVALAVAWCAFGASVGGAREAADAREGADELTTRLDAALSARSLRGAQVAALVVDRRDGRVLYARDPDRSLVPASNMKILTAIAALSVFGPSHRFPTEVYAKAPPDSGGNVDVLAVRGRGDPALTSEQLWRMAADLRALGVRRVRGGLLLDASLFDGEFWHPSWGPISGRAYHAPISALNANYGAFSATVAAGTADGDPVRVALDPVVPYLHVVNRARTAAARAPLELAVDRRAAGEAEDVVVSGQVPASAEAEVVYRSVLDPVRYAGAILRMQLEANGITVEGDNRIGIVDESMVPLLVFEGRPLAEVVSLFLKYSNNAIGETLVKALAAEAGAPVGSWASGVKAVRAALDALGFATGGLTIVDGSGLSYDNRVTPRALVEALRVADDSFRFGPEFQAGLPIAAVDGTLQKRTRGSAELIRAKTGLLTRVTALSGYAESRSGESMVFSVLVNGFRGSADSAMRGVDRFAAELVRAAPPRDEIAPAQVPATRERGAASGG